MTASRPTQPRRLPRPFTMPWGAGRITEEAQVIRDHWEPTIQLMEYEDGSIGLRFCSYQRGRFSRSPLILGDEDIEPLRRALESSPNIKAFLEQLVREI